MDQYCRAPVPEPFWGRRNASLKMCGARSKGLFATWSSRLGPVCCSGRAHFAQAGTSVASVLRNDARDWDYLIPCSPQPFTGTLPPSRGHGLRYLMTVSAHPCPLIPRPPLLLSLASPSTPAESPFSPLTCLSDTSHDQPSPQNHVMHPPSTRGKSCDSSISSPSVKPCPHSTSWQGAS